MSLGDYITEIKFLLLLAMIGYVIYLVRSSIKIMRSDITEDDERVD